MDQVSAFAFAVQGGQCKFKGELELIAVRAQERGVDLAIVGFSAALAVGGFNPVEFSGACWAEVAAVRESAFTNLTPGRVNEVE